MKSDLGGAVQYERCISSLGERVCVFNMQLHMGVCVCVCEWDHCMLHIDY